MRNLSLIQYYDQVILNRPRVTLMVLIVLTAFFGYWIKDFKLDASADSLVLEHDKDLRYFQEIRLSYRTEEFVVITYTPDSGDLFSDETLGKLKELRDELKQMSGVSSVVTMLDVPLFRNPPVPLDELSKNIKTLESPSADKELAKRELAESPLYRNLLVNPSLEMASAVVFFSRDNEDEAMLTRRNELMEKNFQGHLTPDDHIEMDKINQAYEKYKEKGKEKRHQDIAAIRKILNKYRSSARLFLGGVPMVIDDMITYVKNDIRIFGLGIFCFLILALGIIFMKLRWIFLPILCCLFSVTIMTGFLGLIGWNVTVVSSNFISLQLIFTMSLVIHLIVRYREILKVKSEAPQRDLVRETVRTIFVPCLYSILTTMAGFSSLMVSDILPVVNFGWMMCMGLGISLIVTFVLFPAGLLSLKKTAPASEKSFGVSITSFFARATEKHGLIIYGVSFVLVVITVMGIFRLRVENSFLNYFKKSTEIYQGMKIIDTEMGGTTPLDIIINFGDSAADVPANQEDPDDAFDEFDEFEEFEEEGTEDKYWFTLNSLEKIEKVHDYIESLEPMGKVMSLATALKIFRQLNNEKPLDNFLLTIMFNKVPEQFRDIIVDPFVSIEKNQARVNVRIKDSMESLRRDPLLKKIQRDMKVKLGFEENEFRLTNLMVLYNNMLQSLFRSQIKTIGATVLVIMLMFLVLFRSIKISVIAMVPNLISSSLVLGVMGLLDIPLDVMTITIVAISIGIAVDNTIHYIHRFQREFPKDRSYIATMHRCHGSIANAMYYTSLTIITGFSILTLSNFIPTILFGLFTAMAMAMALISSLNLLPRLIILVKPFGQEGPV